MARDGTAFHVFHGDFGVASLRAAPRVPQGEGAVTDAPPGRHHVNGVVTWRAVVGASFLIIGALLALVIDLAKDTSRTVNEMRAGLSSITALATTRLEDHDRRIGKLEDWRNTAPARGIP